MSIDEGQMPPSNDAKAIGERIRMMRSQANISLSELALRAGVSKSYLSSVENGTGSRPGAAILYKLSNALGVTLGDVLGRQVQTDTGEEVPESLRAFAESANLPEPDVRMLAGIKFRGVSPRTPERWQFIYNAIVLSGKAETNDS